MRVEKRFRKKDGLSGKETASVLMITLAAGSMVLTIRRARTDCCIAKYGPMPKGGVVALRVDQAKLNIFLVQFFQHCSITHSSEDIDSLR